MNIRVPLLRVSTCCVKLRSQQKWRHHMWQNRHLFHPHFEVSKQPAFEACLVVFHPFHYLLTIIITHSFFISNDFETSQFLKKKLSNRLVFFRKIKQRRTKNFKFFPIFSNFFWNFQIYSVFLHFLLSIDYIFLGR